MDHAYREPWQLPPSAPGTGRPRVDEGVGAPAGVRRRWERVRLPVRRPLARRLPPPDPVVFSVARGERRCAWAIEPGLLGIAVGLLLAAALLALHRPLVAVLGRLL